MGSGESAGAHFLGGMTPFVGGLARARLVLAESFGHAAFRIPQLRVIGPLLAGRSVLAVLPTGAGKSLCYQVPALLAGGGGLTLVISPLISLMQDQVGTLRHRGLPAAYLNSALDAVQQQGVVQAALGGQVRLLYCAPERLGTLVRSLRRGGGEGTRVALLAVDEAHCIVEWGSAFRPVYRALGRFRYLLGDPITLALTGSATPAARADILRVLRMRDAEIVTASFDRPNLRFAVERVATDRARFARLRALVREATGPVLIYTSTRRITELVTRALLRVSVRAAPYHAGLTNGVRGGVLQSFLAGRMPVVVATSAFGMGIDKPDVRRVIHWGPPRTLESYYQEAGRAGRDGLPAECTVLWQPLDLVLGHVGPEMRRYTLTRRCRRRLLLAYFGETVSACHGCDRCG